MTSSLRTRSKIPTLSAVLLFALAAPIVVHAEDEVLVEEPVLVAQDQDPALGPAVLSWDELSGYGSVEHTRADVSALRSGEVSPGHEPALAFAAAAAATLWDATSGYGSVEASRAANAMDVRWVPARAIVDQALALGTAAAAWDDTSGYGAVEASRAANALPAPPASFTSQVSPDVRWAPAPAIAPVPEDALRAVVAAAIAWDKTSGYGSVEASRATTSALLAPDTGLTWLAASRAAAARRVAPAFPAWDAARWSPVEPGPATNPDYIPAALATVASARSPRIWRPYCFPGRMRLRCAALSARTKPYASSITPSGPQHAWSDRGQGCPSERLRGAGTEPATCSTRQG